MSRCRLRVVFWVLGCCSLLCGCAELKPYHTADPGAHGDDGSLAESVSESGSCYAPSNGAPNEVCVRFVEYDDFGNLFNRSQLDQTVSAAARVAATGGVVVVYVHGWKHSAEPGDDDLMEFHMAMQHARTVYRKLSPSGKREILGIYVGWRGQSLEVPLLNNITFWNRKSTAQAVGDGAPFELFRKLANLRHDHPTSRLVLVGHSFGAAILYSSVAHSIMAQIVDDPEPGPGATTGESTLNDPKRWDMVVLINPAFEAMQLRPHLSLARSRNYLENQLPHLIMITTEGDWATRYFFPAGRYIHSMLNDYDDVESAAMYRSAVGHYIPFITHQLAVVPACPSPRIANDAVVDGRRLNQPPAGPKSKYTCFNDARTMFSEPRKKADGSADVPAVQLTRCEEAYDCARVAGEHFMEAPADMPIWNIRATREVMDDHSDIWNPTMHSLMVQLLLSIVERGTPAVTVPSTPAQTPVANLSAP